MCAHPAGKAEGLNRLFTASTLMSSVLVLNMMRILNNDSLQKLHVLTALSKMVGGAVPTVFPHLCLLLRDFDLAPEDTGFEGLDAWMELHDQQLPEIARQQHIVMQDVDNLKAANATEGLRGRMQ